MNITIIGGGIAGLTTALALRKVGYDCTVHERASELTEIGAGIWMQPNALKVLDWLGLGDAVRSKGILLHQVDITNAQLVPFKKTAPEVVQDATGNKIVAIHRATLQQLLYEALPTGTVRFGEPFKDYTTTGQGLTVQVGDRSLPTDVLIGADGIHSKVREATFATTNLRYSGQTCWRGVASMSLPDAFRQSGIESWGRQIRFGLSQIAPDKVYWFAVAKAPEHGKDDTDTLKGKLTQMYRGFHPLVLDIIQTTTDQRIIRNDISDLKRLPTWHKERVMLVGDAGHATTPNMGQGAGQGMEDAYYLANLLSKYATHETAFQQFEKARRKKVDYVVNNSWRFGQMAHSGWGQAVMKTIMKITPTKVLKQQMEDLYAIQEEF